MKAMIKSFKLFWSRRHLLAELVRKGIRLKYRRSYLGIIWSLLEPILTTIVLTIVFGTLLGRKDRSFPLYILCGRLLYSYFSQATKAAAKSIRNNSGMIKKVYVPKYLYPLSSVLYNYIIFLISLLVLFPLGIYGKVSISFRMAGIVIPLLVLLCMTYGVGLILATVNVFFRDIEYIWDVVLMIIMYTCAIFYDPEKLLKSGYDWILNYNPLYGVIANFRNLMFGDPFEWDRLLYSILFSVAVLLIGNIIFYKKQDKFILHI